VNGKPPWLILALILLFSACTGQPGILTPADTSAPDVTGTLPIAASSTLPATPTLTPISPELPVVASPNLVYLDFQDPQNGWGIAISSKGESVTRSYILRSVDGGETWLDATPPQASIGYSTRLFTLDTNTIWVLVPATDFFTGTLYHTADGGLTWTSGPVPFGSADLQFLDDNIGRALADRGAAAGSEAVELYQTSDGGLTWTSVFHDDPNQLDSSDSLPFSGIKNGMTFLDTDTGWVTGTRPIDGDLYLFVTRDGGVSWAQQEIPLPAGYEAYQYKPQAPVLFGQVGFLPLMIDLPDSVELTFYITDNSGATWLGDPTDAGRDLPPCLDAFSDATHAWCWDGGSILYFTADGTQSWASTATNLDLSGHLIQLDFVPGPGGQFTGWALTSVDESGNSQLYRTTDNGTIWATLIP